MSLTASSSPSPFVAGIEPIIATDDEIRDALAAAEIPPLLPALAYLTGDLGLLRAHLRPDPMLLAMPQGGLDEVQQAEVRELALRTLVAYRDAGCRPAESPDAEDLLRILEFAVGGTEMSSYLPLLEEELAYRGEDRRRPAWDKAELAPDLPFHVVIIGAGMSGILSAHRLDQAGVDYIVLDKNDDVGGTWHESVYPGCRVDNPNHNYSFSFAQRHDWPFHYSTQDVLQEYFRDCADAFDIRRKIRFGASVRSATWDESDAMWSVVYATADGAEHTVRANAVISAVGQLNRPAWPSIDGISSFAGEYFHSAEWRHDLDLSGKRVAVIGTGCSALQFIPHVAEVASSVVVLQRTPPWVAPTPDYHDAVSPGLTWLFGHVPTYSELNRFLIFWRMGDAVLDGVRVDPDWESDGSSVSAISEFTRTMIVAYYEEQFAGRPDLLAKVVPDYPVGAKRIVRDNGIWATTLKRDNVVLDTAPIGHIDAGGIAMADGSHIDADVIIYGTGYQASNFLAPMRITGRGGADLHERWDGDARAYLGVTIPEFPNLFCLYGPNTNIVVNGSIIYFSECGSRLVLGLIKLLVAGEHRALEVKRAVHDEFNELVDAENRRMAWGWSTVNSWYKNSHGRVAQNWPFTLLDYWERTREPNRDDYVFSS
ncbi:MAG: hapE [Ilumatobacteraceae bacterium]|nr:hapE [Ilumatobacteraceae bacterium]